MNYNRQREAIERINKETNTKQLTTSEDFYGDINTAPIEEIRAARGKSISANKDVREHNLPIFQKLPILKLIQYIKDISISNVAGCYDDFYIMKAYDMGIIEDIIYKKIAGTTKLIAPKDKYNSAVRTQDYKVTVTISGESISFIENKFTSEKGDKLDYSIYTSVYQKLMDIDTIYQDIKGKDIEKAITMFLDGTPESKEELYDQLIESNSVFVSVEQLRLGGLLGGIPGIGKTEEQSCYNSGFKHYDNLIFLAIVEHELSNINKRKRDGNPYQSDNKSKEKINNFMRGVRDANQIEADKYAARSLKYA